MIILPSTISTSESELMDRTYMVTPTSTALPENTVIACVEVKNPLCFLLFIFKLKCLFNVSILQNS